MVQSENEGGGGRGAPAPAIPQKTESDRLAAMMLANLDLVAARLFSTSLELPAVVVDELARRMKREVPPKRAEPSISMADYTRKMLTEARERRDRLRPEVARLRAEGLSCRQVEERLGISHNLLTRIMRESREGSA